MEIDEKSHLKIKWPWCIIYLEVIGIESPIALSEKNYKKISILHFGRVEDAYFFL